MKREELEILRERIIDCCVDAAHDGQDNIDTCIVLDETQDNSPSASVEGHIYVDGYVEDDYTCGYMNGTGAFVVTSVSVSLSISVIDENDEEVDVDEYEIESAIESCLY